MLQKAKEVKAAKEEERARLARLRGEKPLKRGERPPTPEILRKPEDIREDARYEGQTTIMVTWVPIKCRDEVTLVDESALREWILFAAVEEDDGLLVYYEDIDKINKVIGEIDKHMKKIPQLEFVDDDGKKFNVDQAREERERLYELFSNERLSAEGDLEIANTNLQNHIKWRKSMGVDLTKGEEDKNTDTCTWYFRLHGTDDAQMMEDLLIMKENWPGIKLAAGIRSDAPGEWKAPPWVGRERFVPDGSKVSDPTDYQPLQINIAGARLQRVPAGVGLYKQLDRSSTDLFSEHFGLFYGEYESGLKSGYGVEIDDAGIYVGGFEKDFRKGRARHDLADGTTISGQFGVRFHRRVPETKKFVNPYQGGEAHGKVEVLFGDGGLYRGEMENGRITGQGDYQSAFNEVLSGTFQDGVLDGDKGFLQNQAEEVFVGTFRRGELHGRGSFLNKRGDSYEGAWDSNMRHGRGISRFVKQGAYRGYYLNNLKHGKGALEYGFGMNARRERKERRAKEREEQRRREAAERLEAEHGGKGKAERLAAEKTVKNAATASKAAAGGDGAGGDGAHQQEDEMIQRELSEFDEMYQGYFFGGGMSNKGSVMNTRIQLPRFISRFDARACLGIVKVLKTEERRQKNNDRIVDRYNDMEQHIRTEMSKKKTRIYNQQKHFAKKSIYEDEMYGDLDRHMFKSKAGLREERLKTINDDLLEYKKAVVPRLRIANNAPDNHLMKAFERIRPEEFMKRLQLAKQMSRKSRRNPPVNKHLNEGKKIHKAADPDITGPRPKSADVFGITMPLADEASIGSSTVLGAAADAAAGAGGGQSNKNSGKSNKSSISRRIFGKSDKGGQQDGRPSSNRMGGASFDDMDASSVRSYTLHSLDESTRSQQGFGGGSVSSWGGGDEESSYMSDPMLERLEIDQVNERLLKIALSDFEEIQERQRFLKYDRMWQRAEFAYDRKRSSVV